MFGLSNKLQGVYCGWNWVNEDKGEAEVRQEAEYRWKSRLCKDIGISLKEVERQWKVLSNVSQLMLHCWFSILEPRICLLQHLFMSFSYKLEWIYNYVNIRHFFPTKYWTNLINNKISIIFSKWHQLVLGYPAIISKSKLNSGFFNFQIFSWVFNTLSVSSARKTCFKRKSHRQFRYKTFSMCIARERI